jgi:hypothetical protein
VVCAVTIAVAGCMALAYMNRPFNLTVVNVGDAALTAIELQVTRGSSRIYHHGARLEPGERHKFRLWCGECGIEVRATRVDGATLELKNVYAQSGDSYTLEVRQNAIHFARP